MKSSAGSTWDPVPSDTTTWQIVRHLPRFVRLYWRLFRDARVSLWAKSVLVLAGLYILFPFDFLPDTLPVVGEIDDLVIFLAACKLFMYLCPPEVVYEHIQRIDNRQKGAPS